MKEEAQTQELEQDELNKYPGLMYSIFIEREKEGLRAHELEEKPFELCGIIVKPRVFQKLSFILAGDSHKVKILRAKSLKEAGTDIQKSELNLGPLGFDIALEHGEQEYKFFIPWSEITTYFELPRDYAQNHGLPDTAKTCPNCLSYRSRHGGACKQTDCVNMDKWTPKESQPEPELESKHPKLCGHVGPLNILCSDIANHGNDDNIVHSATRGTSFFLWNDNGKLISQSDLCKHSRAPGDCDICTAIDEMEGKA